MKKRVTLIFTLLLTVFSLGSCLESYESSRSVVDAYLQESGVQGRIYSSEAGPEDGEYMSEELRSIMFGDVELPSDFTLLVHSRLDSLTELGVFKVESADEGLRISELAAERIELLRTLADGDGDVTVRCDLVIYCFGTDKEKMKETLSRILS
ncbi:MAG: hypothetical protein IJW48_02355 [Clostridia bacterium]|nr:hypothetical protein [Clostridia bacterium]